MIVYVCSPYGGKEENYQKALDYCRVVLNTGNTPIAPHVMLHNILDDNDPKQRIKGLAAGIELLKVCKELWIFTENISAGMQGEIIAAREMGIPVIKMQIIYN